MDTSPLASTLAGVSSAVAHARERQAQSRTAVRAIALCGTAAPLLAPSDGTFSRPLAERSRLWKGL